MSEENKPFYNSSRTEKYLNKIVGSSDTYPQDEPRSRMEEYLKYLCEHGGAGGGGIIDVDELPITPDNDKALYRLIKHDSKFALPSSSGQVNTVHFNKDLTIDEFNDIVNDLDMFTLTDEPTLKLKYYAISTNAETSNPDLVDLQNTLIIMHVDLSGAYNPLPPFTILTDYIFMQAIEGDFSALQNAKIYFCNNASALSAVTGGMFNVDGWNQYIGESIASSKPFIFEPDESNPYAVTQNDKLINMMYQMSGSAGNVENLFHYTNNEWKPLSNVLELVLQYNPDTNKITLDGVEQTYEKIKSYVEDIDKYNVKMFSPLYNLMLYPTADDGGGMCEFTNVWLYNGDIILVRVAINSNNDINYKEEDIATNFQHVINVNATTAVGTYHCQFTFDAPRYQHFAQTSDIAAYLYAKKPNLRIPASGTYKENNVLYQVESIVASSNSQIAVEMYKITDGTEKTVQTGAIDIIDTVL